jgi:hypothetical protein
MEYFKYIVFFSVLIFGVPMGIILGSRYKIIERIILFMSILFTARMNETINFLSHEFYRGTTRGFEISLVDLLSLVLFGIILVKKKIKDLIWLPRGIVLLAIFLIFSMVSIVNSGVYLYSYFEVWKLIRMIFILWVMTNYLDSPEKMKDFCFFAALTMCYIFMVVIYDKYLLGLFQARGPFPHQNSMVMYSIGFGGIIFAQFLVSTGKKYFCYGLLTAIVTVIILASLSRAGLVLYFFGLGLVFITKVIFLGSRKDLVTLLIGVLGLSSILFKASDSIIERFKTAPKESKETRVRLAQAAIKMANDKTLGIGLNNFGLKINYPYPYSKGTTHYHDKDFRGGLVETAYLMIAAESGWHTLVIYLLLLLKMLFHCVMQIICGKTNEIKIIAIGLFGSLVAIYTESTLEWVLRQTTNFYQLMMIFALINSFVIISKAQSVLKCNKLRQS